MFLVPFYRSLDFTLALLQRLAIDPEKNMEQVVQESYDITLKPWHGWISSAAFRVKFNCSLLSLFNQFYDCLMNFAG